MPGSNADWVSSLRRQLTSSLLDQRVGRIRREYPLGGDADGVLVLKPQEPEVVDALQKIRLDEDVARNHAAGDERSVGAIVSIGFHLGDRTRSEERRVGKECRCRWGPC